MFTLQAAVDKADANIYVLSFTDPFSCVSYEESKGDTNLIGITPRWHLCCLSQALPGYGSMASTVWFLLTNKEIAFIDIVKAHDWYPKELQEFLQQNWGLDLVFLTSI